MSALLWFFAGVNLTIFVEKLPAHDWQALVLGVLLIVFGAIPE